MNSGGVAIERCGLVTSVGFTVEQCCAAFRAKVANPTRTSFLDSDGHWITAHQVALERPWVGLAKLARMVSLAIEEALAEVPRSAWSALPLLLCVAEPARPGRYQKHDDLLFRAVEAELQIRFPDTSAVVASGRVSAAVAMSRAAQLLRERAVPGVIVAAADGLVSWPALSHYGSAARLLRDGNSDGFIPGEGGGALLLGVPTERKPEFVCTGIGFGQEPAHINSSEPLRAQGLTQAIRTALSQAKLAMHDVDLRIADLSGEQYYFKEATLALSRTLHLPKHALDIWHPAECTGEIGAVAGLAMISLAKVACEKQFARGDTILAHMANDDGARAALALQYRAAP